MMRRDDWLDDKTLRKRGLLLGAVAVLGVMVAAVYFFVQGAVLDTDEQDLISYCGQPDWFTDYPDKYGYTPTSQCTGIVVNGYRVDTEIREYKDGTRGCYAQYTVYNRTANGDLDKIVADHWSTAGNIALPGLDVRKSGGRYDKHNCMWVSTSYDVTVPGNMSFAASAPSQVLQGDMVPVDVTMQNRFEEAFTGTLTAEFCTAGGFGQDCVTKQSDVSVPAGRTSTVTFDVPTDQVTGNITVTPTLDGKISIPASWQGVNVDCDGDGTIEPLNRCDGYRVGSQQGVAQTVDVTVATGGDDTDGGTDGDTGGDGTGETQPPQGSVFDRIVAAVVNLIRSVFG